MQVCQVMTWRRRRYGISREHMTSGSAKQSKKVTVKNVRVSAAHESRTRVLTGKLWDCHIAMICQCQSHCQWLNDINRINNLCQIHNIASD